MKSSIITRKEFVVFFIITDEVFNSFLTIFRLKQVYFAKTEYIYYDTYCDELLKNCYYIVKSKDSIELRDTNNELIAKDFTNQKLKFYWEFNNAQIKEHLEKLIEYRALIQKSKIKFDYTEYLLQDKSDKGVLRVNLYRMPNDLVLEVEPIKGYKNEFADVKEFLVNEKQIASLFDFVKKEIIKRNKPKLNTSMSALEAVNLLLKSSFEAMREQEYGMMSNIDSEFLHDYRVDLRKARALLSQFKTIFEPKTLVELKSGLTKIGRNTNQARDLDVYWLKVREHQEVYPNRDLSVFLNYLKISSDKEYKKLAKFFKSHEYTNICNVFTNFIELNSAHGKHANDNIAQLVAKKIKKLHKKLLADGSSLSIESEDTLFHELRIDCKKLRYLLEFFESVLDSTKAQLAIKLIKNLQTILGNFQDLSIQRLKIIELADDMTKHLQAIDSKTLITIGMLVGNLEDEQKVYKGLFFQSFNE
ncbi:MAG: hypothetical protein RL154_1324, partial [Pseudomonadota bacterium]